MHADQLRVAIDRIVDTLNAAGILTAVREYRTAKGDQRSVAAARLGSAGAMVMERMETVSPIETSALQHLHLSSLRDAAFWQALLHSDKPEQERAAELVQLYSRVMFASNHLPHLAALLGQVSETPDSPAVPRVAELNVGESRMTIRLSDAGEKASDPDRIARSIDGIDMLYSASASLSRRSAMDLRLDHVIGNSDRSITFTGESDSVAAMAAIIDSIPDALGKLNDDQAIDLDALVQSLPIFEQLNTLAGHGAFSENDIRDIRETMHQGALLTLESGVMLPESPERGGSSAAQNTQQWSANKIAGASPDALSDDSDEHYERYLKEREAMQNGSAHNGAMQDATDDLNASANSTDSSSPVSADQQSAVDELLRTLHPASDK